MVNAQSEIPTIELSTTRRRKKECVVVAALIDFFYRIVTEIIWDTSHLAIDCARIEIPSKTDPGCLLFHAYTGCIVQVDRETAVWPRNSHYRDGVMEVSAEQIHHVVRVCRGESGHFRLGGTSRYGKQLLWLEQLRKKNSHEKYGHHFCPSAVSDQL